MNRLPRLAALLLGLAALALAAGPLAAADWQPAKGPLMTRWAKDVTAANPLPEYPRPTLVRADWLNLNGLWQLAEARPGDEPPLGKTLPDRILVPFPVESALSGVMKPLDRVWYRRTFTVPAGWAGRRVLLHFGAVNWEATVWVNGQKLGSHKGGYDGFSLDVTPALRPTGEQEIVVGVWNPIDSGPQPRGKQVKKPGGIFYTASTGIWQTAWLEPVAPGGIAALKVSADPADKAARLEATFVGTPPEGSRLHARLKDGQTVVAEARGGAGQGTLRLEVAQPKLWSPESPHLYDLDVTVLGPDGQVLDKVTSYTAFRSVAVAKDKAGVTRLMLNGQPYFQVGPLDQGFWPDGLYTAPTDEALRYDVEITKKLGFNMTRKHVKVEPERWYYWCDRLGLVVWQDMPSGDGNAPNDTKSFRRSPASAQQFEHELARMVEGRRHHPSIIMWVPFNEGWGQYDTPRIVEKVKKLDPTRLVNPASGWHDFPAGDVHDVHAYPGPASPEPEPTRAAVLGEFGGLGLGIDGHTWTNKTWGYRGTSDRADLTRKYENLLQRVWRLKDKPGLSAAVYTQITDVETEANGLLTYDRAVIKVDLDRAAAANRGDFSKIAQVFPVVPTSWDKPQRWRYTVTRPADGWFKSDFDDSSWKEGPGGFGTKGTPGSVVRTEWSTPGIWLRREFTLAEVPPGPVLLSLHHDEDVQVYLNGVLAASAKDFTTSYEEFSIRPEAAATLKPGKNVLAVHCRQTRGGQYIDVGLVRVQAPAKP